MDSFKFMLFAVLCTILTSRFTQSRIIWLKPISQAIGMLKTSADFFADLKSADRSFKVYWNSPTTQCKKYEINFEDINENYGIRQNTKDTFRGDQIALLYDPGMFPALLEQKDSSEFFFRNGGLPQEGSLEKHLEEFRQQLDKLIPDANFNGLAVIDFESWRPIFRQNFGVLTPYKNVSFEVEKKLHPDWDEKKIKEEAIRRFNEAGPPYMLETLKVAKEARPLAKWGYYAFPYCFNMNNEQKTPNCSDIVIEENNRMAWLWDNVDLLLPSVYMSKKKLNAEERQIMVKGRVSEAKRLASLSNAELEIYPYLWYKYSDETSEFLTKDDLYNAIDQMKKSGLNGVILWGSSGDVNNKQNCLALQNYVKEVLGPVIKELGESAD